MKLEHDCVWGHFASSVCCVVRCAEMTEAASTGRKRPSDLSESDARGSNDSHDGVSRSALDGILAQAKANIISEVSQHVSHTFDSMLKAYDGVITSRISKTESDVSGINLRCEALEARHKEIQAQLSTLQEKLVVSSSTPQESGDLSLFDRKPEQHVLHIGIAGLASKASVLAVCSALVAESDIPGDAFDLRGPALGRSFNLAFHGDGGLGCRRARKVMTAMRNSSGEWRQFSVLSPSGAHLALFIGFDKSSKQIRLEQEVKKLYKAVKSVHPQLSVDMMRRDGVVCVDWIQLAKVQVDSPTASVVLWNTSAVVQFNIDKAKVTEAWTTGAPPPAQVQWSV